MGSSPQVRGTCREHRGVLVPCGIIPAGAGHLYWPFWSFFNRRDHPRRCGALNIFMLPFFLGKGSSPQVRGTWHPVLRTFQRLGDHPRRCGALGVGINFAGLVAGSSPQVRGTCYRPQTRILLVRIIPAGAGHFDLRKLRGKRGTDHPRRCGALQALFLLESRFLGSSPQVRGTSARQKKS